MSDLTKIMIEEIDGKRLYITTFKRYIKSVEKRTANTIWVEFE